MATALIAGKMVELGKVFDYGKMVWQIPYKHPGIVIGWNTNEGREHEVSVRWSTDNHKAVWFYSSVDADWLIWNTPHH